MSRHTPLHQVHHNLGATFTDFAGWSMPVRYTSEVAEHHAVRTTAGLFDLCHMGELELTGPQAGAALDHALVGRPSKIGIGRARYSMLCEDSGGIVDDLVVYRRAEDRYLLVANASNVAVVMARMGEHVANYAVDLHDASDDWSLLAVQGQAAVAILQKLTSMDVSALRYYAIDAGKLAGHDVLLARTGYTGEDGFEVYCRPDRAVAVWSALSAAGAPHKLVAAGLACRDTLRLEAGMPLYGNELTSHTTPLEAGLGRLVDFEKPGDFVGRDALAAGRDTTPVRTLVGLVSSGRRSPRSGYTVLDPRTREPIGNVTSGAPSPTLGHPIAMAYVPVASAEPGNALVVDVRGSHENVEVVPLPFYRRPQ